MIKRIFIKDYNNINDPIIRNKYGKVAGMFGIFTNLILGVFKLILGLLSNSVSVMVDSINNIFDTVSSILTLIGFKLSSKKPNKKHPYGYARYEYISGFLISIIMFIMGLLFIKESLVKIVNPVKLNVDIITFVILFGAIIGKLILLYIYSDFAKIINSKTLKANVIDTRNDILSTTSILLSLIIFILFEVNIDGYVGLLISIFIIYSSIKMLNEVIEPIIGIIPTPEKVKEIEERILSYKYVKGIHDLVIHNYGVHNDFVTVHVEIDSKMDIIEAHDLMDIIENDFKENLNIDLTIHMDPIVIGDVKVDKLKNKVLKVLKNLDEDLTIHDFRIVEGKKYTNVLFDCVIPYEKNYSAEDIKKELIKKISSKKHIYNYMIEIDRPYC